MIHKNKSFKALVVVTICLLLSMVNAQAEREVLAHWRFEQIKHLKGDSLSNSIAGQPLTASDRGPTEPQPYVFDDSGKGNFLQVRGSRPSPNVFSDNVPFSMIVGKPNKRSLVIKKAEYLVNNDKPLAFYDMQKSWTIEASMVCNLLGTEQVFLCKEGPKGALAGDLSLG